MSGKLWKSIFVKIQGQRSQNTLGVNVPTETSDKTYIYKVGRSRLDVVSQEFYNSPFFGWLILQANPQFGGLENYIYDGAVLIIPYPLLPSLQDYKAALENYFYYYGR